MRILLTGVSGRLGRATARQLIAAGHAVTGVAGQPHSNLHPDVEFVAAGLGHPVLHRFADASDVVLHLDPIDPGVPGASGIDGLVRVADAAAQSGARLIFPSAAAGGPLHREAESLVGDGWAPSLVVRTAPLSGRQLDWMICRTVTALLQHRATGESVRLLHFDDLLRFLVIAVATDSTGTVDLAGPGSVDLAGARESLRSAGARPGGTRAAQWDDLTPPLDPAPLPQSWHFDFAYSASDAVADTARGLRGRKRETGGATVSPGRIPLPFEVGLPSEPIDGAPLRAVSDDEHRGEFDDLADPRFPVFSAAPLAERLPGPLTPVTLDVQPAGLRAAARAIGAAMDGGDAVAAEWGSRAITVFGHRPYLGLSVGLLAAEQLPGWSRDHVLRWSTGLDSIDALFPLGRPRRHHRAGSPVGKTVVLTRALGLLRNLKADTETFVAASAAEHVAASELAALSPAALQARIRLLRDRIHQGWELTGRWLVDSGVTAATLRRRGVGVAVDGLGALLDSDAVSTATSVLADRLRPDSRLCALALDGDLAGITDQAPEIGAVLGEAVARIGHRGPGELELANLMIGDDPAVLLAAAGRIAIETAGPRPVPAQPDTLSNRLASSARASREVAYDTTVRFVHELRMTLRELGSRYVATELIDVAGEVFYLTCDEAVTLPTDARLRIKRRRAERERFQSVRLPDLITVS